MAVVRTRAGILKGTDEDGLLVFRGVPYAAPPTGELRWRPPEPTPSWSGEREATRFASAAPQCADDPMPLPNSISDWSEDCLYLNVWTPGTDGASRPVMVWFHGGGFVRGSATRATYDRAVLARRGDVVFVTAAYRLGALGFLFHESLPETTNLGLRDQVRALEWIASEIRNFGGDPDNVTVFGHSAGASSIGALLGSRAAEGLFRRAILQSGAPVGLAPDEAARVSEKFLEFADIRVTGSVRKQLVDLDINRILEAQRRCWEVAGNRPLGLPFLPVVDGGFLAEDPGSTSHGLVSADLLVGTARDELKPYLLANPSVANMSQDDLCTRLRELVPHASEAARTRIVEVYRRSREARGEGTSAGEIWLAVSADRHLRLPLRRLLERHAPKSATYSYSIAWESPFMNGALGAFHEIELPFLLGYLDDPFAATLIGDREERWQLARDIQDAWIAFARSGRPVAQGLPDWPEYDAQTRQTMVLDAKSRVASGLGEMELQTLIDAESVAP